MSSNAISDESSSLELNIELHVSYIALIIAWFLYTVAPFTRVLYSNLDVQ